MSKRLPCPPAPGPLEEYAARFDELFCTLAQRRGFREYLQGLLLPKDRNKTLTALAGTEPIVGAQGAPAQRLQFFLSESGWDAHSVNARRLQLLGQDSATKPHADGVLIIDETGDRKDGKKTAHVAHQYLRARWAGSPTVSCRFRACGPTRASTIRCTSSRMSRPSACPAAGPILLSAPSLRSGWIWSIAHEKRASLLGRWWLTPFTGRARISKASCGRLRCPTF